MDITRAKWCWAFVFLCGFSISSSAHAADDAGTVAAKIVKEAQTLKEAGQEEAADKKLRDAAKSCEERLLQQPDDAQAHFALAQLQVHLDQVEAAKAHLERAMQLEPNNAAMYALKGRFHGAAKQYPEAIKACRRSLELDPKNTDARQTLAACLLNQDEIGEASEHARELVRLKPNDIQASTMYAVILLQATKHEEWEQAMRNIVIAHPKDKKLREFFVFGFVTQERYEKAYRESLELQKLDPEDPDQEGKLVVLATQARQSALAATHIERLREFRRAGKVIDDSFARDDFVVGKKRVIVGEKFELKGGEGIRFVVYVLNEKQEQEFEVSVIESPVADAYLAKMGKLKKTEKAVCLIKSQNGKDEMFVMFSEVNSYETIRAVVVEIVEGTRQPWQPDPKAAELGTWRPRGKVGE